MTQTRQDTLAHLSAIARGDDAAIRRLLEEGPANLKTPLVVTAASLIVNPNDHEGRMIHLARAAGVAVTLPAAVGSLNKYRMLRTVAVSGGSDVIKPASGTYIGGVVYGLLTIAAASIEMAQTTDNTLTMNGSTQGGLIGSYLEFEDVASGLYRVNGMLYGSGTFIAVFSAT